MNCRKGEIPWRWREQSRTVDEITDFNHHPDSIFLILYTGWNSLAVFSENLRDVLRNITEAKT
jgi:hypothetical protein